MTEKKRGRPKGTPLVQVLAMKGTPEWREWLQEFANHVGVSSSELVDIGLEEVVKREGFKPPPKRTGVD